MSAFIPRRDDAAANEAAFAQVRSDKQREADQGFDGAWIAHPGLVEPVLDVFQAAFSTDNQLSVIPRSADRPGRPVGGAGRTDHRGGAAE